MPRTIAQGFETFRSNLEITDLQEETVSVRQQSVRAAVAEGLNVIDDFLTGSYKRSTMIAPLKRADVDVFIVLSSTHYNPSGQRELLEATRTALRRRYPKTPEIHPDGQAVTIEFEDFKVDVVPGFNRQGGGYLIPDATGARWIETNPKFHVEHWSAHNKWHDGSLVPMIKMLKAWNRECDAFRSFHLEAMAVSVFHNVKITNYWSGARYFFDKARDKVRVKLPDPAGYSDDVAAHVRSEEQFVRLTGHLASAYSAALAAERQEQTGMTRQAFGQWRAIFGDYFPAWG